MAIKKETKRKPKLVNPQIEIDWISTIKYSQLRLKDHGKNRLKMIRRKNQPGK